MQCKWCGENEVNKGEKCGFCGTLFGEDKPRIPVIEKKHEVKKDKAEK
jgi:hypothetical protein